MTKTPTHSPGERPPGKEKLTYVVHDHIGLWCTYCEGGEEPPILCHVWLNGAWVDGLLLFGSEQFMRWCEELELRVLADDMAAADDAADDMAIDDWLQKTRAA